MKTLLTALLFIITISSNSQSIAEMQSDQCCSKARFLKQHFLQSKDIVQTPLLNDYDVTFYFLDIAVESSSVEVAGNVTIQANVVANQLDTFAFELLDEVIIDSILVNAIPRSYYRLNDEVFVPLVESLPMTEQLSTQIFYRKEGAKDLFTGIATEYDSIWNKHVTWTLSEPFNARQWWPCKQVLTDKADSVWVFLTTNENNKAGSIGLLQEVTPLPQNKVRFEWKSNYPIAYYLISLAVAEYQEVNVYAHPSEMGADSILIQNYIYDSPGCYEQYQAGIEKTADFMELFSDLFTLYPFHDEKYGHCLARIGGGMEHQTMTTIRDFGFGLVAHELGHMWFGDNVTCATWSDIWINEGFASYADYLAHEFIANPIYPPIWLRLAHETVLLEPDGSVYVPPEEVTYENVNRIFNSRLSYKKGALLLHMIRFDLQDDALFFDVLKNFQVMYADSVATGLDFMEVLNSTTGKDFSEFFDTWYFGEGYPIYNVNWMQQEENFQLTSIQGSSAPMVTPFFKMVIPYKIFFHNGTDTTLNLPHISEEMTYNFSFPDIIDSIQVDPERWVIKKVESVIGIQEMTKQLEFLIAPNPATDVLELNITDGQSDFYKLEIADLKGKQVFSDRVTSGSSLIDIRQLKPSVYIIQLKAGKKTFSQKFIKQK